MMIRVMYSDGRFDMVKPSLLEKLLKEEAITSFKRSSGWAVVGRDPIRSEDKIDYGGAERRVA
ncbi:MAG: GSU3473 family protein [Desulfuromonadales bacterium]